MDSQYIPNINAYYSMPEAPSDSVNLTSKNNVPPAPTSASVQPTPQATQNVQMLTPQQVLQLVEQLKPATMSNPIKVVKSSYLITEEQMTQLLSVASGSPITQAQSAMQTAPVTKEATPVASYIPNTVVKKNNVVDTVLNATLGTVGRTVHTFTGLMDNLTDVLTLGYSEHNKK